MDGLLILMYIFYGSSEVLVLPSHYTEIINCCGIICDVAMVIYKGGALRCSLNLFPNDLEDSPIYSSSQSTLLHFNLYITPFLLMASLSLGVIKKF